MVRSEFGNGFAVYDLLPGAARMVRVPDWLFWRGRRIGWLSWWSIFWLVTAPGRFRRVLAGPEGPHVEYSDKPR